MKLNIISYRPLLSIAAFCVVVTTISYALANAPNQKQKQHFLSSEKALPSSSALITHSVKIPPKFKTEMQSSTVKETVERINLNTATMTELVSLRGVGPKKAQRIIDWRIAHKRFRRVIDLRRVKGFGPKSVRKLLPFLKVG